MTGIASMTATATAPRRAPTTGPKPDWSAVAFEAFHDDANFARVLADMKFARHHYAAPRGLIECWPPDYAASSSASPHRPMIGQNNRSRRDADVHFVSDADTLFLIEAHPPGPWRTASGAQRGDDISTLGMLRWDCRFGQAAYRIARIIGMRAIPTVTHA